GGGGHELLLRDVHLEVALWVRLLELVGVSGVAHLSIERNDVRPRTEGTEGAAVRFASGDLVTAVVPWHVHACRRCVPDRRLTVLGRPHPDAQSTHAAAFRDGALRHAGRPPLAVPA